MTHSNWDHYCHQIQWFWDPFPPSVSIKIKMIGQYWPRPLDGHYILQGSTEILTDNIISLMELTTQGYKKKISLRTTVP